MITTEIKEDRRQMIFRFSEELTGKIKLYAKRNNKSVNSYVEDLLSREIQKLESVPHLELPKSFDEELLELSSLLKGYSISDEEIEESKYKYLMEK